MPASCAVACCKNTSKNTKDLPNGKVVSFFTFPKDGAVRDIWIAKCNRKQEFNASTSRMCSDHFAKEDFVRNLRAELMQLRQKKILKEGAVPSRNLTPSDNKITKKKRTYVKKKSKVTAKCAPDVINLDSDDEDCFNEKKSFVKPKKHVVKKKPSRTNIDRSVTIFKIASSTQGGKRSCSDVHHGYSDMVVLNHLLLKKQLEWYKNELIQNISE